MAAKPPQKWERQTKPLPAKPWERQVKPIPATPKRKERGR